MTRPRSCDGDGEGIATHVWVVDRVEGSLAVLITDDDERQTDVPLAKLPRGVREGTVLCVPEPEGEPRWEAATVDEDLREARLREAEKTLERLRRRDPGGDIAL